MVTSLLPGRPATAEFGEAALFAPSAPGRGLARSLARVSDAPLREGNALTLLRDAPATYADWLAAIARAEHWIHLEDYIFKSRGIGREFAEALKERAAAGVRVRVLYDWWGSADVPRVFWRELRAAGIDVRVVHPPSLGTPMQIVARDHSKLLAIDGKYASIGGIGIDDHWLKSSPITGLPYRDTAVRVTGPAVADLERHFASAWSGNGSPLPAEERPVLDAMTPTGDVALRVIGQDPWQTRSLRTFQLMTATVERRLWIADAYFVGAAGLVPALLAAARDGVDVRVLLPGHNDLHIVGALSRFGYRPLLEAGIGIFEYAGLMMHAKTIVADGWWGRVGLTNLNPTGLVTNWEVDVCVEDPRFAAAMEAMFEDDLAHAREIRLAGPVLRPRVEPVRKESMAEQRARREVPGRARHSTTALGRAGIAAFQAARHAARQGTGTDALQGDEHLVTRTLGAAAVGAGLAAARFPRLLAWPLAALSVGGGALALLHSYRAASADERAPDPSGTPPTADGARCPEQSPLPAAPTSCDCRLPAARPVATTRSGEEGARA